MTDHLPIITCDPRNQFGLPCVAGTGVPVDALAWSIWTDRPVDVVADHYRVEVEDVWWCCAWWAMHRTDLRRHTRRGHRWRHWATHHAVGRLAGWVTDDVSHPDDWRSHR